MRTFEARYPGTCPDCGDRFGVGDQVGYDSSDDLVCADCLRDDHRTTTGYHLTVCPDCHCIHEGECW